jgi:hypothetical protein
MSKYEHAPEAPGCDTCQDRGWFVVDRAETACTNCETGAQVHLGLERAQRRPAPNRTTDLRLLVEDLTHSWTFQGETHAGLIALVAVHDVPVHMESSTSKNGGKVIGSPMPCATDVTMLISDLTTGTLAHEQNLHALLGMSRLRRSGTLRSLAAALNALPDLWSAAHDRRPDHWLITGGVALRHGRARHRAGAIERDIRSWHYQCRELIGAERRWSRVPTTCSVCGTAALRQRPRDGSITCTKCGETWAEHELGWLNDLTGGTTA